MSTAGGTRFDANVVQVWVASAVLAVSVVFGWIAMSSSADSAKANHEATSALLSAGIALADGTAALATQLQGSVEALAVGTASAAESIGHTTVVAANVQALIDIIEGIEGAAPGDDIVEIETSLVEAKASLLENQGGLDETTLSLSSAQEGIADTVTALQAIPDQLRTAQTTFDRSDDSFGLQRTGAWIAALGASVGLGLVFDVVRTVARRQRQTAAAAQP